MGSITKLVGISTIILIASVICLIIDMTQTNIYVIVSAIFIPAISYLFAELIISIPSKNTDKKINYHFAFDMINQLHNEDKTALEIIKELSRHYPKQDVKKILEMYGV